ncbi:MAG: phytoene/squalene synthase family protein [Phycisphaeraceae bacterium]|nr:MAG: phytoene/squalene synthase family protein [Phycisphaeraceae bacterium]
MSGTPVVSSHATMDQEAESAFAWCRDVTRREARNFYYGLRLTPEPKRSAIFAVYAWMRAADDIVDDEDVSREKRRETLDQFRSCTDAVFSALPVEPDATRAWDPRLWQAFRAAVEAYRLDPADFHDVFTGLTDDIETDSDGTTPLAPRYRTREELEAYCYSVASTVGLICVRIWGVQEGADFDEVRTLAIRRGLAFQLTNILRDLAEDFAIRRVYIPGEVFDEHGLTPEDLVAWRHPERCEALVHDVGAWARRSYEGSQSLERMLHPESVPAMWAMTRIYSDLLEVILRDPSRLFSGQRIRLAGYQKAAIGLRAFVRARRSRA